MRFGKFLTTRGILSAAQVLAALGEQSRRRRFLPQFLAESGVVSADYALEYETAGSCADSELLADTYRQGLLTARQYNAIEMTWKASAPPLGEILVEQGFLSSERLQELLLEYHASESSASMPTRSSRLTAK